jgi:Cadherin-like/Bacterial Ig domain
MRYVTHLASLLLALLLWGVGGGVWLSAQDLSVSVTFIIPNNAPIVDLNGGAVGSGYASTFTERGGAVSIVDAAALTWFDSDQLLGNGATVTISNLQDGVAESLDVTLSGSISKNYNPATGVLTLSGSDSIANYQAVLRTLVYNNSSFNPTAIPRTVSVVINDGLSLSVPALATVNVIALSNAPIVDLNGVPGGIDYSANFTEGGGAVSIVNATTATVSDSDNDPITGATVTLTNPLDGVNDVVAVIDSGGITSSYNSGTGVLTLTGTASASAYQTVLRTLTYNNTTSNPTTTPRVVTVTASDGGLTSVAATTTITVFAINNTPTLAAIADQTMLEDSGVLSVPLSGITNGGDGPGQMIFITATSSNTALVLNPTIVYTSANPTGTLLLTPITHQFGSATITVLVRDDGGTALGSVDFITRTFTVTVTPVNDRPTLSAISNLTITENDPTQVVGLTGISPGPVNETGQSLTLSAVSSRPDIIPNPTVLYTSPQATGTLTFTPNANVSDVVNILVTVSDNGGTANGGQNTFTRSFTVTVVPVVHTPVVVTNAGLTLPGNSSAVISYLNLEVSDLQNPAQLVFTVVTAPTNGNLTLAGVTLSAGSTFTQEDINSGLIGYTHTGVAPQSDNFVFNVINDDGNQLRIIPFTIAATADLPTVIPVVTMPNSSVTWVQGSGAVILDTSATVLNGGLPLGDNTTNGTLTVSTISGSTANDQLAIRHVGTGTGQISVVGATVSYEGTAIGTIGSNGSAGTSLSISLNGSATPTAVEALVRNLTFTNDALAPGSVTRRVQVLLTNGSGGISGPVTKDVLMVPVNQVPLVTLPVGSASYTEASPAIVLDASATFSDVDSPTLPGATITATWTSNGTAADQLWIRNQGVGANQIGVIGNVVSYNGAIIGFLSGGLNGGALSVTLTSLATPTTTQELLRNLTFDNTSLAPSLTPRQLSVVATDGDGGTSVPATLTVVVQGTEDPPVLTLPSPPTIYLQGAGAVAIDPAATVNDPDSVVFTTGVLAVEFNSGADAGDRLFIHPVGSGVGEIDVVGTDVRYGGTIIGTVTGPGTLSNPLLIVLNNQATVAATQALVRRIGFRNDVTPPVSGPRVVQMTLTDGTGATSVPVTTTITVQAVNAPPVVTLPGGGVNWLEGTAPVTVAPAATVTDVDTFNFPSGSVTITITDTQLGDVVDLRNDGTGAGQIGVSANTVTYGGTVIGTVVNSGSSLVVSLNAAATQAAIQDLVRALTYASSGQVLLASTRTIQVVVNDGQNASTAVTTTVSLTPMDDAPLITSTRLITVRDIPAEGTLIGSDPEGAAVTWQIVSAPSTGTLTLVNAATGAVHYVPDIGAVGDVTFTARLSDGTNWSSPATMTVRITDRLVALRPLIITSPPREGYLGTALTYQVVAELGGLPLGTDLNFHLVGVPAGSTAAVTKTGLTSATVTWTASGTAQQHQELGLIVSDPVTGVSSYQPIQIVWQAAIGGSG